MFYLGFILLLFRLVLSAYQKEYILKVTRLVKLNNERFVVIAKYKLDKWIVGTCLQIIFLGSMFGLFFGLQHGVSLNYYECIEGPMEHPSYCENPFYKEPTWENMQTLDVGKYGSIPWYVNNCFYIASGLLLIAVLLNHYLHNRGYKIEEDTTDIKN